MKKTITLLLGVMTLLPGWTLAHHMETMTPVSANGSESLFGFNPLLVFAVLLFTTLILQRGITRVVRHWQNRGDQG